MDIGKKLDSIDARFYARLDKIYESRAMKTIAKRKWYIFGALMLGSSFIRHFILT